MPAWLRGYRRAWLRPDLIAGVVIWSVVTPQAVAYAQIAGLGPEAGLMAAPVAMLAFGLLGTSRQLIVSATTATSAVSAATIGPLAGGDTARFAALSAALALVVAVVLILGGFLRFGAISDLVSKPVMTGFLFGLGMVVALAQLPSLLGVAPGEGNFFPALWDVLGELDTVHGATLAVGGASLGLLILGRRFLPGFPALAGIFAAGLILLTGAFLAPLFKDLPQATLAAIVMVAIAGFFDVAELRRFVRVRRSAIVFALLALASVLALGVLQGLVVAAALSLVYVVARLSRPSVGALARVLERGVAAKARVVPTLDEAVQP